MSISKGVALVTGASRGIGRAIALRLAHDGYALAINDIPSNLPILNSVKAEIESITYGGQKTKALSITADVREEEQVKAMVEQTVKDLGAVDVMVANAGILQAMTPMVDTSSKDFDQTLAVNIRGVFLCYKYAAKQMIAQHQQRGGAAGGNIIGASSVTGKQAWPALSAYSASKWAVRGLTQSSALELAPYGIRVNAYAPGFIDTKMVEQVSAGHKREHKQYLAENVPLRRMGTPEDVANLVSFLVSDKASYITGQAVSINGGLFFD
ncbi:acetoin reductase family protein [Pleurotus eryngii]|uniref:Acetoin reductase family protein n=1 Tax=Pleurotus eryngii TaxID=5323 RepID=A0A9P6D9Q9_PLEER|nr:acetoin reductase family protein [Pleurotus eryngii]